VNAANNVICDRNGKASNVVYDIFSHPNTCM
jgi:hypothetical protein